MESSDPILTVPEVAADLRCSRAHVYNVINGSVDKSRDLAEMRVKITGLAAADDVTVTLKAEGQYGGKVRVFDHEDHELLAPTSSSATLGTDFCTST